MTGGSCTTCYQRRREAAYNAGRSEVSDWRFRRHETWDEVGMQVCHRLLQGSTDIRCVGRTGVSHGCGSSGTFVPSCPRCFCSHSHTWGCLSALHRFRYCLNLASSGYVLTAAFCLCLYTPPSEGASIGARSQHWSENAVG